MRIWREPTIAERVKSLEDLHVSPDDVKYIVSVGVNRLYEHHTTVFFIDGNYSCSCGRGSEGYGLL